jgi:hypothetical protein
MSGFTHERIASNGVAVYLHVDKDRRRSGRRRATAIPAQEQPGNLRGSAHGSLWRVWVARG